ncbi:MAG: cytochrome c biogenesis protein CcdA [Thermaerobacterales bacterium]
MDPIILSFAFSAGAVSAFNPCGVAVLPSYLAYLFVKGGRTVDAGTRNILRGAMAGGLMTLGFVIIFVGGGLAVNAAAQAVRGFLPWFTVAIGAALAFLGLLIISGRRPSWLEFRGLPMLQAGQDRAGAGGFFVYGLVFALTSLGCTLPIFLVVVAQTFAGGPVQGITGFLFYALGMGLVVTGLSVGVMIARAKVQKSISTVMPFIDRVSGALISAAGLYLMYYWLWGPGTLIR